MVDSIFYPGVRDLHFLNEKGRSQRRTGRLQGTSMCHQPKCGIHAAFTLGVVFSIKKMEVSNRGIKN